MNNKAENLTAKTVSGTAWSAIAQVSRQSISLVSTAILAHLLPPSAYGLLGMVMVVIGFVDIFKDLGTSAALIQRKHLTEELISSIFWLNILLGVLTSAVTFAIAPWVAQFYNEPQVTEVMTVLSFSFVISSFGVVQQALLSREMAFDKLARVEVASAAISAIVGVTMAASGKGVWSLVALSLVSTILWTVLVWPLSPWRPKQWVAWAEIRSICTYSLNLSGFTVLNYFVRNTDNLLIGRYLGTTSLGYYLLAYNLLLYPVQIVSGMVGRVLFPAFVQIQHDNSRFRLAYLRIVAMIGAVTFPLMLGMFVLAGPLVVALFGAQWMPSVILVMILAPLGAIQSIGTTVGHIYMAKGRTDWMLRWGAFAGVVVLTSFAVGLTWGLVGVALAYAIASGLVLLYPNFAIPFKLIDLPIRSLLNSLWPGLQNALVMAGVLILLRLALDQAQITEPWTVLLIAGFIGSFVYIGLMVLRKPPVMCDLVSLMPSERLPGLRRVALRLGFVLE